ncbi:MAG TPA: hypothetical protein DD381_01530 [Lentisphaeria bacterium]|nr:MAG: hypothetical protein A2X47_10500 [Lentisphaerae bacterium GWF2_38_69]HBM15024.1 hypothetical protein [Lentisphaeria bacterium]
MSELKKVLITVKTYPTLSKKYDELVCTAGILEDSSWIRIYPLPFRKLDYDTRYNKYQWIEVPLEKNKSDPRPESYRPTNIDKIKLLDTITTKDDWSERRKVIINKGKAYTNLTKLIEKAKKNELSLATFKPSKILDLTIEETDRDWPKDKLDLLKLKSKQLDLFQTLEEIEKEFSIVPKLPYKFSYKFTDDKGQKSTLMIEDWEIGALYWNCLKSSNWDEKAASEKVKDKYFREFSNRDLYLFLGTTQRHHFTAPNPFVIIGVFYPPFITQPNLFDF